MIINVIYETEPKTEIDNTCCIAYLLINGKIYTGKAHLNPEDADFFSEKIGFTIALSRARRAALEDIYHNNKIELVNRISMYNEAIKYNKDNIETIDPTNCFKKVVERTEKLDKDLREAIKRETNYLKSYFNVLSKTYNTLRNIRKRTK